MNIHSNAVLVILKKKKLHEISITVGADVAAEGNAMERVISAIESDTPACGGRLVGRTVVKGLEVESAWLSNAEFADVTLDWARLSN